MNDNHNTEQRLQSLHKFVAQRNEKFGSNISVRANSIIGNPLIFSFTKDVATHASNYTKELAEHTLHGSGRSGKAVEIPSQNEFGCVLEEGYSTYYVGPFKSEEEATSWAEDILGSWLMVGSQVFLVQDKRVWRKEFTEDGEEKNE